MSMLIRLCARTPRGLTLLGLGLASWGGLFVVGTAARTLWLLAGGD